MRTIFPRLIYSLFSVIVALSFISCSFDKPSAPSWDVEVTLPLISKVYTMQEIAEDESSLGVDSTGVLFLELESEIDRHYVGDQLTLDPVEESFQTEIGKFKVDAPGTQSTFSTLREIYPQADALQGKTVVVPSFSFATDKKILDPYENFVYVVIDTGRLNIKVENNLPVPLGSPLTLEIWDVNADTLILTETRNVQIDPGTSQIFSVNLGGHKFVNLLAIRILGQSPGSGGQFVTVDANSRFNLISEISNLQVSEALAQVPQQIHQETEEIALSDSLVVKEALIEKGRMTINLGGSFPLDTWVIYSIPDLLTPSGLAYRDSIFIPKRTVKSVTVDLSNYKLKPAWANLGQQKVKIDVLIKTLDTGRNAVLVKNSDFVEASVQLQGVVFSQVSGTIGNKTINIVQSEIQFDIPTDLDSIFFETARMELQINNGINFPARTHFIIEGMNESGAQAELNVQAFIQPAPEPGVPATSVIVLDKQNSNIEEFISILPNLIRVFGEVSLGNESWVGTVSKNDYVSGTVKIQAPIAISLPPQTIESDVDQLEIDDKTRQDIEDHLSSGSFYAEVANHLPLGASVEFLFAQVDSMVFHEPILKIGPVAVSGATVGQDGFVQAPEQSEISLNLSEQEMQTFLKSPLFVGLKIHLDGTQGQKVKVRASDYIQVKSYGKIKMKIEN